MPGGRPRRTCILLRAKGRRQPPVSSKVPPPSLPSANVFRREFPVLTETGSNVGRDQSTLPGHDEHNLGVAVGASVETPQVEPVGSFSSLSVTAASTFVRHDIRLPTPPA
jgi:hypothetical protein